MNNFLLNNLRSELLLFIAIIIAGLKILELYAHSILIILALICLILINFEFFFKKEEYKYNREIINGFKLFFNTNSNLINLSRKDCISSWLKSSVIILIIITIIKCLFYIFRTYFIEINWEYIFVYLNNQPYLYIIIMVVLIQVVLITISVNKFSLNEMIYFLGYILTLRIIFALLLNLIFAYNTNEIIFLIGVYDIISRSDILGKISTSLQPNALIAVLDGLRINWYNQLNNYLLSKYKSIYFNRIIPFQCSILSESSCNKVSLVKPKLLGSGYYRSQFQPYTLPQVYVCPPFNVELIYNKIFSSPTLTIISDIDYINLIKKYYSDISLWDDESTVGSGSSWDGDTVIGSEINWDLNVCDNDGAAQACSKLKDIQLKDPQLNFSSEYFHENRIQSVFVNKGKDRATSLDLTSYNEENSHIIVEDIDLNQLANWLDEDVNRALNESRQTHQYNLRVGESSSRGAIGLYGQGNTTTSVIGLASLEAQPTILEDENMVDQQIDLVNNESIAQEYTSQLPEGEAINYSLAGIDGGLENRPGDLDNSAQLVQQFVQAQSDSEDTSSLSSHNSVEFIDIWDSDLTIREFKSFSNSVINEELFSNELYKKFLEDFCSPEEISSIILNDNLEESSHEGLHLSLEGLVSMSKNEISNLIKEFRTNNPISTTSYDENKLNKIYKGNLYFYVRKNLYYAKTWFNIHLGNKKLAHLSNIQKEELTSNFTGEYDKLKDELNENKDSHEFLNDLLVRIEDLVKKFRNPYTKIRREDKAILAKILDLQRTNRRMKSAAKILIGKSNLDDKIKDILLKQVEEITTNINAGFNIGNEIDHAYIDELNNKIQDIRGRLVKRSHLICNDTLSNIAKHQFRSAHFYPSTKNSLLIAKFHQCIRNEIIKGIYDRLFNRVDLAAKKGQLIKDKKLVSLELSSEFKHLRKNMYLRPNLQDACQHLVEVLVKLNNKYYYPCNMKFAQNKSNYFIYTKLKEIIIRFIKKDK